MAQMENFFTQSNSYDLTPIYTDKGISFGGENGDPLDSKILDGFFGCAQDNQNLTITYYNGFSPLHFDHSFNFNDEKIKQVLFKTPSKTDVYGKENSHVAFADAVKNLVSQSRKDWQKEQIVHGPHACAISSGDKIMGFLEVNMGSSHTDFTLHPDPNVFSIKEALQCDNYQQNQ